jgi:nucleosome binding factor SPN SPT16 subunit
MAEIKIDKTLFQERLSHFVGAWKADKRSGDALFNGASSILVLMGKTEEAAQFQKNNAIHVRILDAGGLRELRSDIFRSSGCLATSSLPPSFSSP